MDTYIHTYKKSTYICTIGLDIGIAYFSPFQKSFLRDKTKGSRGLKERINKKGSQFHIRDKTIEIIRASEKMDKTIQVLFFSDLGFMAPSRILHLY